MTRRISVVWPDRRPFDRLARGTIRLIAVSDEADPTLEDARNRSRIGEVDLVVGCGDLAPSDLAFVADAFGAPLAYVLGNHDAGEGWRARSRVLPAPLRPGVPTRYAGILIAGLPWAGAGGAVARRDEVVGWQHAIGLAGRRAIARSEPLLVVSHAAPRGVGDSKRDAYHEGFAAYRWVLDRFRPPLWLHGHTPLAAADWQTSCGPSAVVNVTGSVLVELVPPGDRDSAARRPPGTAPSADDGTAPRADDGTAP